jgi:acetyltransferase-like isoleucine patch superfamily enzyme
MKNFINRIKWLLIRIILKRWVSVPDPYNHPQVKVGDHTHGLFPSIIRIYTRNDRVEIGKFCSIAKDVKIVASGEKYSGHVANCSLATYMKRYEEIDRDVFVRGPVIIGHDVWIGTGAIILPGTKIGNGAIIAAGAVVRSEVDHYAVVGGVPARLIRYRFNDEQRRQLLDIAWWNWPDALIQERLDQFYGSVDDFISLYKKGARPS